MEITTATENVVKEVHVDWARREGWNPGVNDHHLYFISDGFFIGYTNNESKEPIACISAVKYGASYGFIGYYIVDSQYRGKGFGYQIFSHAMKYLNGRTIGLDAVEAQESNYKKLGFKSYERNCRFAMAGGGEFPNDNKLVDLKTISFDFIENYDEHVVPHKRPNLLFNFVNQPESFSFAYFDHENTKLLGYGIIRKLFCGYKVAPLYADTPEVAELLFNALRSKISDSETVFIDIPNSNIPAIHMAEKYNMKCNFSAIRMYYGDTSFIKKTDKVFGISSMEIG